MTVLDPPEAAVLVDLDRPTPMAVPELAVHEVTELPAHEDFLPLTAANHSEGTAATIEVLLPKEPVLPEVEGPWTGNGRSPH